jgi:hypothetical protein
MFQFPRFASPDLWIQSGTTGHYPSQVPPFGHPRVNRNHFVKIANTQTSIA